MCVANWHCWLSINGKNIDLGKTITHRMARETENILIHILYVLSSRFDKINAGTFHRVDLETEEER